MSLVCQLLLVGRQPPNCLLWLNNVVRFGSTSASPGHVATFFSFISLAAIAAMIMYLPWKLPDSIYYASPPAPWISVTQTYYVIFIIT
ncbi:hypothetical protein CPC08DRAFT_709838 [Agrocybe pediades]|nr:hypothetical protein CPC08DRAFT_709838 [Agrocybe pediades]